eukprot:s1952_g5.t1
MIRGLHWSPGRCSWSVSHFGYLEIPRVLKHGVVLVLLSPAKAWQEETGRRKIGNVETYLKWTFLPPVENAMTRPCSLAKKGKCKALPVCRTNFETLKVWILFSVPSTTGIDQRCLAHRKGREAQH